MKSLHFSLLYYTSHRFCDTAAACFLRKAINSHLKNDILETFVTYHEIFLAMGGSESCLYLQMNRVVNDDGVTPPIPDG
jgi:hypothetical protein